MINFPSNPTDGQVHSEAGSTWNWNAAAGAWKGGNTVGAQGVQGAQGFQGPTGVQGPQGFQGLTGPQGVVGAQGPVGVQGPQGTQGLRGFQGFQGVTGAQGPTGVQGPQGFQGPVGVGTQGPQGVTGVQGPQGVPAPTGTYVLKAGDTMTGHLSLPTNPAVANAVRRDYVDSLHNTQQASIDSKYPIAGYYAWAYDADQWHINNQNRNITVGGGNFNGQLYSVVTNGAAININGTAGQYYCLNNSATGMVGMTFHHPAYAFNFGYQNNVDGANPILRVGGWSALAQTATSFRMVHEGMNPINLPGVVGCASLNATDVGAGGRVAVGQWNPYNTHKLNVYSGGPHGMPAASGTTDTAVVARFDTANVILDFGNAVVPGGNGYGSWVQSRIGSGLNSNGTLVLNPNGGGVGIGTPAGISGAFMVKIMAGNNICWSNQGGFPVQGCLNDAGSAWVDHMLHAGGAIKPYADNSISMGNSARRWTALWAVAGTIQTSDARAKTDVQDSPLGLDFINTLHPVSYKWIVGKNVVTRVPDPDAPQPPVVEDLPPPEPQIIYKNVITPIPGQRTHYGLIAQEVAASVQAAGVVDFGGYIDPTLEEGVPPDTELGLRYDEFIAPLIKAVQELSAKVVALEAQVAQLTGTP